jgi:hypothetical protein
MQLSDVLKNLRPAEEERQERDALLTKWMDETPLAELPCKEVHKVLEPYHEVFRLIEQGARREYCDFGLLERIRQKGIGTLLPETQAMHEAAYLLSLRIRLAMAEGRMEDSIRDLQTGFAMARHLAESPAVINYTAGVAHASRMTTAMDQLIQLPNAPNLYWALTDLPHPLLDLRKSLQGERVIIYGTFPGLREAANDLRAGPFPPERVQEILKAFNSLADFKLSVIPQRAELARKLQAKYEAGKKALLAQGRPRDLVEKMPHVQVALLHSFAQYDRFLDDLVKCYNLPYWDARLLLQQMEKEHQQELKNEAEGPALPIAGMLVPKVTNVFLSRARLERKLAALRCLEAVRLYAAAHKGQLPTSLSDITEVPIPIDPLTGQPFAYRRAKDEATLQASPPAGEKANETNSLAYELTLKR